jgi:hypothetical protein
MSFRVIGIFAVLAMLCGGRFVWADPPAGLPSSVTISGWGGPFTGVTSIPWDDDQGDYDYYNYSTGGVVSIYDDPAYGTWDVSGFIFDPTYQSSYQVDISGRGDFVDGQLVLDQVPLTFTNDADGSVVSVSDLGAGWSNPTVGPSSGNGGGGTVPEVSAAPSFLLASTLGLVRRKRRR